jgi:hypothetical protein
MIERLPTGPNRGLDPPTSSVPVANGDTAREGAEQGRAGNDEFNRQLEEQFNRPVPGNSPFYPKTAGGFGPSE